MAEFTDKDAGIKFDYTVTATIKEQPKPIVEKGFVRLRAAEIKFVGKVKASFVKEKVDLLAEGWRIGFIQEILSTSRKAIYGELSTEVCMVDVPPTKTEHARKPQPIRDGNGPMPFDGNEQELVAGQEVKVKSEDDPNHDFALSTAVYNLDAQALTRIEGEDRFRIWLAACRTKPDKRLVILAAANWKVQWGTTVQGTKVTPGLACLTTKEEVSTKLAKVFSKKEEKADPAYPQDLSDIEAEDFIYTIIRRGAQVLRSECLEPNGKAMKVKLATVIQELKDAGDWWR